MTMARPAETVVKNRNPVVGFTVSSASSRAGAPEEIVCGDILSPGKLLIGLIDW